MLPGKYTLLAGMLTVVPALTVAAQNDPQSLKAEAVTIVKQFGATLKPQLKQAMQVGGPVNAIQVCATKAPEIARELSRQTGWQVKRVSLKPRNSETGVADNWERRVLQQFDQQQASGKSADELAFAEITEGRFRFMKAQGVETICLNCHGGTLAPEVTQALQQYYPDDRATGYQPGQIRGAFSLAKDL